MAQNKEQGPQEQKTQGQEEPVFEEAMFPGTGEDTPGIKGPQTRFSRRNVLIGAGTLGGLAALVAAGLYVRSRGETSQESAPPKGIPVTKPEVPAGQLAAQKVVTGTVKTEAVAPEVKKMEPEVKYILAGLRESLIVIDETSVAWPEKGSSLAAVPVHDQKDLNGNSVRGRSILEIRTGTTDFEWVGGGRYAFIGKVNQDLGTEVEAVSLPDGAGVVKDKKSGKVLYMREKNKIVIPGGTDKELRGNIVFVLGNSRDITATVLEADTASNYREKRNSGLLNQEKVTPEGVSLLAAMGKVYANSMYNGRNCKGSGCRDAVGVYVVRGGDEKSGQGAELLFAAVYSGKELEGLKLKNQ